MRQNGRSRLPIEPEDWFGIDPATNELPAVNTPIRRTTRLRDGSVYAHFRMNMVQYSNDMHSTKTRRAAIVTDVSPHLKVELGFATGISMTRRRVPLAAHYGPCSPLVTVFQEHFRPD